MPFDGLATFGFQYANSQRGFIRNNRLSDDPDNPGFYSKVNSDFPLAFGETFSPYSGSAFIPGPGANWDKTKYYLDFGYSQRIADALLDLRFYKNIEDRKEKNYSSSSVNNAYPDGELVLDRDVASDRSYGGSLELSKPMGEHELLMGVEHKVLAYGDTDTNFVDLTYNNAQWIPSADALSYKSSSEGVCWGYYVQDTWKISEHWLLTGGLRYDRYENKSIHGSTSPELEDDALTPKLTGTYKITDTDTMTVSAYQALRTPGLPETYWWAEGATQGDPKEGDVYDTAGLSDEIDYLPEWKISAGLEFNLPYQSVFNIAARYVGERQAIYAYSSGWQAQQHFKLVTLDSYITADINLKVPVGKHAEFSCYVENLFDEEYEEQFGYPLPGVIVGAALKLSL